MEKQGLLLVLIIVVAFMAVSMFVLYSIYKPLGETDAGAAASQLVIRSFILYAAIMVVTILLLLIAFWVEIYVLKPKVSMKKMEAQKWVVEGEVKIENELSSLRKFLVAGNISAAEASYRRAVDIYNWLQDYELSERKNQDYYLRIDKARLELEQARLPSSTSKSQNLL